MNRVLSIAAVVLAVAALALSVTRESPPPAPAPVEEDLPPLPDDDRVRALEAQVDALARRMTALERRPLVSDAGVVAAPAELAREVEAIRQEMRGLVAGEALNSEGGREYLKETLRSVQEEMRVEQRQAIAQRLQQAQAERTERWKRFATEAGLSYAQEQELLKHLEVEQQRREATMELLRGGTGQPREVRRELRAAQEATDDAMAKTLSAEQLDRYRTLRREERQEFRGAFGGR